MDIAAALDDGVGMRSNGSVANLFVSEHGKKNASAVEEHVMLKGRHLD